MFPRKKGFHTRGAHCAGVLPCGKERARVGGISKAEVCKIPSTLL